jgi:hypothetical protein
MVNAKRASPPLRSSTAALPLTRTRRAPAGETGCDGPAAEGAPEADVVDFAADPQDESSGGVNVNVIAATQMAAR